MEQDVDELQDEEGHVPRLDAVCAVAGAATGAILTTATIIVLKELWENYQKRRLRATSPHPHLP